jgi:hypothetical protein
MVRMMTSNPRELVLEPVKRGWRLTINAADMRGRIETSNLTGMAQILAAYGRFRVMFPGQNAPEEP